MAGVPRWINVWIVGVLFCLAGTPVSAQEMPHRMVATDFVKKIVYHSPQTPGYTCWVDCWLMPDGQLRVSFTQATGPFEGRPRTRKDVGQKVSWPPEGKPEYVKYDMAGLNMEVIYLASNDGGSSWEKVSFDPAATPMNGWVNGAAAIADGTIFRNVWGQYLPFYDVPQTGYWQSSRDGGRTWGARSVFFDEHVWKTWPKRLRILRDGRLLVAGGVLPTSAANGTREGTNPVPALWVSEDHGQHWSRPILLWSDKSIVPTEEVDVAELPDGDLLAVMRVDSVRGRWQTVLAKDGKTWKPGPVEKLWIPHSGMPELMATREGIVLHLATDGVAWTADKGTHWAYLADTPKTGYYPASVQLPDGRIFCVYHVGGDNYYGEVDQRIEAITFRIKPER